ncbi:MAG: hypothetical protein Q8N37_00305 [bacterium]|nr:hypothetical protein [bacterium]
METKKENHKSVGHETHKRTDETVFELTLEKKKKKLFDNKSFSKGFLAGFFIMAILATGIVSLKLSPLIKNGSIKNPITLEQAKIKAETFINKNLMAPGSKITIKGAEEKNGLYKIAVNTGSGNDIDAYMTKDGKIFFPQAVDIEKTENDKKNAAQSNSAAQTELVKSDKPEVELFVMSHCPYGTQIEKGILPVVSALGNKINFDIKFTDYAMHGEKELQEELSQYCIKTNEPAKFNNYLKCFIESTSGDSATCLTKASVNKTKLSSCVAATDKKFKVTANFADKNTWKGNYPTFNIYAEDNAKYGVPGSPTLIINGATADSARDSASLLKTICSAFNTPPKECSVTLSATAPAPGFGTGVSTSASSASCGN